MSGLATLASELEHLPRLLEAEKRLRRLEYLMMILVGLLLAVIVLKTG
jgi:predicted nucleic acid-binding Zn ribbon protein